MKIVFNFNKRQAEIGCLVALAALAAALRLWAAPRVLVDGDGVDFALALSHFDPLRHQPHFPIYPVFIAVARLFAWLPAPLALAVPGALGGALMVAATGWLFLRRGAVTAAWISSALLAVTPALVTVGGQAGSDGLGLGLAIAGGCVLVERAGLGGLLLGLALGARPSYLPLIAPLFVLTRDRRHAVVGLTGGVAVWLVPLVAAVGPHDLWMLATTHTARHLDRFATSDGISARGATLAFTLLHAAWPALLVLVAALVRRRSSSALAILALAVPYVLWVWLAQNTDHARHAAPLVAALTIAAALAADRAWAEAPRRARTTFAAAWLTVAAAATAFPTISPWRAEAVERIRATLGAERVIVAGTSLPRVAAWYAPELRTARATDAAAVAALTRDLLGVRVVVSSEIPHLDSLQLSPLGTVGDERLYVAVSR
jgi:hypothetical protein